MDHVGNIEKNLDILLRCIDINVHLVACLRAAEVIDGAQESRLSAEKAHHDKLCLLLDWIKIGSYKIYESFLQVMEENEQQHVVNLLKGIIEGNHVPLSIKRHARLLKIRPNLIYMIHNNAVLISELRSSKAISRTDMEDLSVEKVPNYKKNYNLIGAILRKSDHSFECLIDALRNTRQSDAADYLIEGDVIPIHVSTTAPELDEELSDLFNAALKNELTNETLAKGFEINESMAETAIKEIQIPKLNGLVVVGATPGDSIVIFVFCKTTGNMVTFTQLFNSGELQTFIEGILNCLYARIEPRRTGRLEAHIRLSKEEILAIEEMTGLEDWCLAEQREKIGSIRSESFLASCKRTEDVEKPTDRISSAVCSMAPIATSTHWEFYWRQERRAFYENFERLLTEEEELLIFFLHETAKQDRSWKQRRIMLCRGFEPMIHVQNYILKFLLQVTKHFHEKLNHVADDIEFKLNQQQESWKHLKRQVLLELEGQSIVSGLHLAYSIEYQANPVFTKEALDLLLEKVMRIKETLTQRKQMIGTELFSALANLEKEGNRIQNSSEMHQRRLLNYKLIGSRELRTQRQPDLNQIIVLPRHAISQDDEESAVRIINPLSLTVKALEQRKLTKRKQPEYTRSLRRLSSEFDISLNLPFHHSQPSPAIDTRVLKYFSSKSEGMHTYGSTLQSSMLWHLQSDAASSASSTSSVSSGYSSQAASTEIIISAPDAAFSNLVQTIRTKAAEEQNRCIIGLTILEMELFVVSGKSSEVEVYDSLNFKLARRWLLKELIQPFDIASCNKNSCLYIMDHKRHGIPSEILKVDGMGELANKWSTDSDWGYGLSVTDECNVILAVHEKHKLNEYSPNGILIREIKFSSDSAILHPWHAIKLRNGDFFVSHGSRRDPEHRVCRVDSEGRIVASFGGKVGVAIGQLNGPWYMATEENETVIVSDWNNRRVLLLDTNLKFKKGLVTRKPNGLQDPRRIHLDRLSGRLFLTDNGYDSEAKAYKNGRILVFNVKDDEDCD